MITLIRWFRHLLCRDATCLVPDLAQFRGFGRMCFRVRCANCGYVWEETGETIRNALAEAENLLKGGG